MTMSRRTLLAGAAAGAVSPTLAQTQQDPTMADKRLSFSSGGRSITVDFFPAGRGMRRPAVIMLHGADGEIQEAGEARRTGRRDLCLRRRRGGGRVRH